MTTAGTFRFQHRLIYLANALVDQPIGLEETDDGVWSIYFNTVLIGTLDERDLSCTGDTPKVLPMSWTLLLPISPAAHPTLPENSLPKILSRLSHNWLTKLRLARR